MHKMSGGALDYVYFRLDDPIKELEKQIRDNGKTLQQIWDDKTEEEKENAIDFGHDWEIPWTEKNVPDTVCSIAEEEAWKKCKGVKRKKSDGREARTLTTKKTRDEWSKIYKDTLTMMIESHNNGIERETYSDETIEAMKKMLETIKRSQIYLKRIEWLLSGDDGEDNFLTRVKEDLEEEGLESDIA